MVGQGVIVLLGYCLKPRIGSWWRGLNKGGLVGELLVVSFLIVVVVVFLMVVLAALVF